MLTSSIISLSLFWFAFISFTVSPSFIFGFLFLIQYIVRIAIPIKTTIEAMTIPTTAPVLIPESFFLMGIVYSGGSFWLSVFWLISDKGMLSVLLLLFIFSSSSNFPLK